MDTKELQTKLSNVRNKAAALASEHNAVTSRKEQLFNEIMELNGQIKLLTELLAEKPAAKKKG